MVKELKLKNCEIIICISHSGITKEKDGEWGGEDVELARSVKGLNLIIGGHSHTKLSQPLLVNEIPYTSDRRIRTKCWEAFIDNFEWYSES